MVQRKTPPKATSSPKTQAVSSVAKAMLMASLTAWKVFIFFVSPIFVPYTDAMKFKKEVSYTRIVPRHCSLLFARQKYDPERVKKVPLATPASSGFRRASWWVCLINLELATPGKKPSAGGGELVAA
jgi:hypothetical protein